MEIWRFEVSYKKSKDEKWRSNRTLFVTAKSLQIAVDLVLCAGYWEIQIHQVIRSGEADIIEGIKEKV